MLRNNGLLMSPLLKSAHLCLQSCLQAPRWDPPAHPPSSRSPPQFFLLSNRRVPLPLSSGPKAPLRLPAPVAMGTDSEVSRDPLRGACDPGAQESAKEERVPQLDTIALSTCLQSSCGSWWVVNGRCTGLMLHLGLG